MIAPVLPLLRSLVMWGSAGLMTYEVGSWVDKLYDYVSTSDDEAQPNPDDPTTSPRGAGPLGLTRISLVVLALAIGVVAYLLGRIKRLTK